MKKIRILIAALFVMAVVMVGIALPNTISEATPAQTLTALPQNTVTLPANTATNVPTDVPATQTLVPPPTNTLQPTATPALDWKLAAPGAPNTLDTELREDITYVVPEANCAVENNPNGTCSTLKGQATDADFTLQPNAALRMTGDLIVISQNGLPLAQPFDPGVKQTMWVVVNASSAPITNLHMTGLYGSFHGYFLAKWDEAKVDHMVSLGLYQYIASNNPLPTAVPVGPTAVKNCESTTACEYANTHVAVWTGSKWVITNGYYSEGDTTHWQQ